MGASGHIHTRSMSTKGSESESHPLVRERSSADFFCPLTKGHCSAGSWHILLLISVSDTRSAQLFSGVRAQVHCACRVPFLMKVDFVLWRQLIVPVGCNQGEGI